MVPEQVQAQSDTGSGTGGVSDDVPDIRAAPGNGSLQPFGTAPQGQQAEEEGQDLQVSGQPAEDDKIAADRKHPGVHQLVDMRITGNCRALRPGQPTGQQRQLLPGQQQCKHSPRQRERREDPVTEAWQGRATLQRSTVEPGKPRQIIRHDWKNGLPGGHQLVGKATVNGRSQCARCTVARAGRQLIKDRPHPTGGDPMFSGYLVQGIATDEILE